MYEWSVIDLSISWFGFVLIVCIDVMSLYIIYLSVCTLN